MQKIATIASIVVNLSAQTAAFISGMEASNKEVKKLTASFEAMKTALKGAGIAALAAFAFDQIKKAISATIDTIVEWTKSGLEAVDTINDLAIQLGTTTEEMSFLGYAARISGSDIETLARSLNKLRVNLGKGDKGALAALKNLGVKENEVAGKTDVEIWTAIAEGVKKAGDGARVSAAEFTLLGKAGTRMHQFLREGAAGIQKLREEFRALGLEINSFDAEEVAKAKDEMDKLAFLAQNIKNKLAIAIAPYLTAAIQEYIKWGQEGHNAGELIADSVEVVITAIGQMIDVAHEGRKALVAMAIVANRVSKYAEIIATGGYNKDLDKELGKLVLDEVFRKNPMQSALDMIAAIRNRVKEGKAALEAARNPAEVFFKTLIKGGEGSAKALMNLFNIRLKTGIQELGEGVENVTTTFKNIIQLIEKLAGMKPVDILKMLGVQKQKVVNEQFEKNKKIFEDTRTAAERRDKALLELETAKKAGLDPEAYRRQKDAIIQTYKDAGKAFRDNVATPFEQYKERVEEINRAYERNDINEDIRKRNLQAAFGEYKSKFVSNTPFQKRGSAEAQATILAARGVSILDPLRQILQINKEQLEDQKNNTKWTKLILDLTPAQLGFVNVA